MGVVATGGLLLLGAVNTAMTAKGQHQAAKGAKAEGELQGELYDTQAADALTRGNEAASRAGAATRGLTGSQRAAFAAQGVDINSGSAGDVIANDKQLGALDVLSIQQNAARESHGFELQANLARKAGANAARNYNNQAISTLLTGGANAASTYYNFRGSSGGSVPRSGSSGSAGSTNGGYNNGTASR